MPSPLSATDTASHPPFTVSVPSPMRNPSPLSAARSAAPTNNVLGLLATEPQGHQGAVRQPRRPSGHALATGATLCVFGPRGLLFGQCGMARRATTGSTPKKVSKGVVT